MDAIEGAVPFHKGYIFWEVEVVYSVPGNAQLRGIRIDLGVVQSAPERISEATVDELAFDSVLTGVLEPRPSSDFLPMDADSIRWLSVPDWLREIT